MSLRLASCEAGFLINSLVESVALKTIHIQFGSEGV